MIVTDVESVCALVEVSMTTSITTNATLRTSQVLHSIAVRDSIRSQSWFVRVRTSCRMGGGSIWRHHHLLFLDKNENKGIQTARLSAISVCNGLDLERNPEKTKNDDRKKSICKYCYNSFENSVTKLNPYKYKKYKDFNCLDHCYA